MPKDVPFHELSQKSKKRRLTAENVEESNSTDSSIEFDQSDNQQSYAFIKNNSSKIPDKTKSELSHYSELALHSEFVQHSKSSDNLELSEHFESSDFESDDFESDNYDSEDNTLHENINPNDSSSSNSSSSQSTHSVSDNSKMIKFLRGWALKHNVTHEATSDLLKDLKENHECFVDESKFTFPVTARTLLKTKVKFIKKVVEPGYYIHIGLQKQLLKIAPKYLKNKSSFKLLINIDGLPLFKSSPGQVYPILCTVVSVPQLRNKVFPIGIYYGTDKPVNLEGYLKDFVAEINSLNDNGLRFKNYTSQLDGIYFVCDAPAKSFIMGTVSHTGFHSCTRCTVRGITSNNRRIFTDLESPARTCEDFLQRRDPNFRRRDTPLTNIMGLDFVHDFVLDYLHLECLGVMRPMIMNMWYKGPIPHRLSAAQIESVSNLLVQFQCCIPAEFVRKPRELYIVLRWKGTEFRLFILYIGPVVLKNVLNEKKYIHFLEFHFAMRILLNVTLCRNHELRQYAKSLLKHFVQSTAILYDQDFIAHNFHNNIHIADDADYFIDKLDDFSLHTISVFPFENYMQNIKRKVRGRNKPFEQIGRRIEEIMSYESDYSTKQSQDNQFPKFCFPHNNGPVLSDCTRQYNGVALPNFKILNRSPNNCCGTAAGDIILVENIAFCKQSQIPIIIGREFLNKYNFYTEIPRVPAESSRVGVFKVGKLSDLKKWSLSEITTKYIKLPSKKDYIVSSILHCDTPEI